MDVVHFCSQISTLRCNLYKSLSWVIFAEHLSKSRVVYLRVLWNILSTYLSVRFGHSLKVHPLKISLEPSAYLGAAMRVSNFPTTRNRHRIGGNNFHHTFAYITGTVTVTGTGPGPGPGTRITSSSTTETETKTRVRTRRRLSVGRRHLQAF